jgi:hypothetical protein
MSISCDRTHLIMSHSQKSTFISAPNVLYEIQWTPQQVSSWTATAIQVVDSLTNIHNATVQYLLIVNRRCIHKGFLLFPKVKIQNNSNLVSLEAMQWVLFCLSIGHDKRY